MGLVWRQRRVAQPISSCGTLTTNGPEHVVEPHPRVRPFAFVSPCAACVCAGSYTRPFPDA
eukprot:scaffold1642_cov252-Pinguiococcus_pyrenoidosus.AAC.24